MSYLLQPSSSLMPTWPSSEHLPPAADLSPRAFDGSTQAVARDSGAMERIWALLMALPTKADLLEWDSRHRTSSLLSTLEPPGDSAISSQRDTVSLPESSVEHFMPSLDPYPDCRAPAPPPTQTTILTLPASHAGDLETSGRSLPTQTAEEAIRDPDNSSTSAATCDTLLRPGLRRTERQGPASFDGTLQHQQPAPHQAQLRGVHDNAWATPLPFLRTTEQSGLLQTSLLIRDPQRPASFDDPDWTGISHKAPLTPRPGSEERAAQMTSPPSSLHPSMSDFTTHSTMLSPWSGGEEEAVRMTPLPSALHPLTSDCAMAGITPWDWSGSLSLVEVRDPLIPNASDSPAYSGPGPPLSPSASDFFSDEPLSTISFSHGGDTDPMYSGPGLQQDYPYGCALHTDISSLLYHWDPA